MEDIITKYKVFVSEIDGFWDVVRSNEDWDYFYQRMSFWSDRVAKNIEDDFSKKYANDFKQAGRARYALNGGNDLKVYGGMYKGFRDYLSVLEEEIVRTQGELIPAKQEGKDTENSGPSKNSIFIVHGHDLASARSLEKYLEKEKGLRPIILQDQPSEGKVLIDKFEGKADNSSFIFIVFTPDDMVVGKEVDGKKQENYKQARPNVFFEMGWFYGKVGRSRIRIIRKVGATIPSDLDGITRIDYNSDISQAFYKIDVELKAAGMIK